MTIDIEGMKRVVELSGRCSMLYWWPKVKNLGIPVPRTEIVEIPSDVLFKAPFEPELLEPYMDRVYEAARRIGHPLFLRSDQLSGKHDWVDTCYVPSEEALFSHIIRVLEWHHLAQVIPIPARALVLREFLELDWAFRIPSGELKAVSSPSHEAAWSPRNPIRGIESGPETYPLADLYDLGIPSGELKARLCAERYPAASRPNPIRGIESDDHGSDGLQLHHDGNPIRGIESLSC